MRYFDWFGTYLLEEVLAQEEVQEEEEQALPVFMDKRGRVTYIDHVDARGALLPSERRAGAVRVPPKRRAMGDFLPTPSSLARGDARLTKVVRTNHDSTPDA